MPSPEQGGKAAPQPFSVAVEGQRHGIKPHDGRQRHGVAPDGRLASDACRVVPMEREKGFVGFRRKGTYNSRQGGSRTTMVPCGQSAMAEGADQASQAVGSGVWTGAWGSHVQ